MRSFEIGDSILGRQGYKSHVAFSGMEGYHNKREITSGLAGAPSLNVPRGQIELRIHLSHLIPTSASFWKPVGALCPMGRAARANRNVRLHFRPLPAQGRSKSQPKG